ncbi:MAG: carbohydrate ABC transporter permease [Meiothermus sp.]|uniref:carbohydrate ABC transporter permease n=1 Tax=Meiothermus sp. TaxID=1955249 RepID=UPI0025ECB144|nr:carbohydrate ABC transporter permease [Meiothermus sp.]MCS7057684.1 carbohydrate ABC transporter permease [Meiothermus sp.]MCS7193451.1 carbohydrate ABC transporter permease [Meiothermus sp.]MCX7740531.1 carbohydrate ABC transporter permease [Meiothermus sp.]MDW8091345.1 carbohydrate ABC transporter permease [Meiothermus sp.]MDW8482409.1 carbohydrate ABC transporter permease [Meiothermus sp.]
MRWAGHAFVGVVVFLVALPFIWMAYAAFIPPQLIFTGDIFSQLAFSLENFRVLSQEGFWDGFWGRLLFSALLTGGVTLLQLLTGFLAAYALKEGAPLLPFFLLLLAIPVELLLVPLYGLLAGLRLLDTLWALVLPFAASPFIVYLLFQGMRTVPEELLEAARLDGAGHRVLLTRILLPLLRPQLIAAGVLAFAAHWNLVLYPRIVAGSKELKTVQTWITDLQRQNPADWGPLSAAALAATLPLVIVYLLYERRIVETFEEGLKG